MSGPETNLVSSLGYYVTRSFLTWDSEVWVKIIWKTRMYTEIWRENLLFEGHLEERGKDGKLD
jgi:hypothetical protein